MSRELFLKLTMFILFMFPMVNFSFSIALGPIFILLFIIYVLTTKEEREKFIPNVKSLKKSKESLAFMFICLWTCISSIWSSSIFSSMPMVMIYSFLLVFYFTLKFILNTERDRSHLLFAFYLSLFLICAYLFSEYFITVFLHKKAFSRTDQMSTLDNANILAVFCLMGFFMSIGRVITSKKISSKVFFLVLSLMSFGAIMISQSRAVLMMLMVGLFIAAMRYNYKFIYATGIFGVLLMLIAPLRNRIVDIFSYEQNILRVKIWRTATAITAEHPFLGTGVNNFNSYYRDYITNHPEIFNIFDKVDILHAHNIFLRFSSELGIPGLIAIISLIYFGLSGVLKHSELKSGKYRDASATYVALLSFYLSNIFDSYFMSPKVLIIWTLIMGLYSGYLTSNNMEKESISFKKLATKKEKMNINKK